jgi:hypothetical protein
MIGVQNNGNSVPDHKFCIGKSESKVKQAFIQKNTKVDEKRVKYCKSYRDEPKYLFYDEPNWLDPKVLIIHELM